MASEDDEITLSMSKEIHFTKFFSHSCFYVATSCQLKGYNTFIPLSI
jgi:hypothetical protein